MTGARPEGRPWRTEHHLAPAGAAHDRDLPDPMTRVLWWFEVTAPAIALGSTQDPTVVDATSAAAAGVDVVRRRSGGGAVWLAPGVVTWVDVLLPAGDPLWTDDVGRASAWLGTAWAGALRDLGVDAVAHPGPMVRSPHSGLVCFAGLAPGEVSVGSRKVVGISQRRTRRGARFQCAVLHEWDPGPLLALLRVPPSQRRGLLADLAEVAVGIGPVQSAAVVAALVGRLRSST